MSRSYSKDVAPDRSTLRTVFRDTFRSRAISLIVLPLMKCSRRIRPIVSTVSIPPPLAWNQREQRIRPILRGSILDADPPAQGVKIARRITHYARTVPTRPPVAAPPAVREHPAAVLDCDLKGRPIEKLVFIPTD